ATLSGEAIEHFRGFESEDHPLFAFFASIHTTALVRADRLDEAERFARDRMDKVDKQSGSPSLLVALAMLDFAEVLATKAVKNNDSELTSQAADLFERSLLISEEQGILIPSSVGGAVNRTGSLLGKRDPARAEAILRRYREGQKNIRTHQRTKNE